MVILKTPIPFSGVEISWTDVTNPNTKTTYKTRYMKMQTPKTFAIIASMTAKKYRIFVHNTKNYMSSECAGTKYVIAEDNNFDQICKDWDVLIRCAQPLLEEAYKSKKSITLEQLGNIISSPEEALEALKMKQQYMANQQGQGSSGATQDGKKNQDRSRDLKGDIQDNKGAVEVLRRYTQLLNSLKSKAQSIGTPKENDQLKQAIKQGVKDLIELDKKLAAYFIMMDKKIKKKKTTPEEEKIVHKLEKSYKELRPTKDNLFKDPKVRMAVSAATDIWAAKIEKATKQKSSFAARDAAYKKKHGIQTTIISGENQQQIQIQQPKFKLTKFQAQTIDTELNIAKETRDELLQVESEFNELTEMFKDFNRTIQEQDVSIKQITKNVDSASLSVTQGIDDLKKAKSYSRFGIM